MKIHLCIAFVLFLPSCSVRGSDRDPVSHETAIRQARPRLAGERFDPQESDPRLLGVFATVDAEVERAVGNVARDEQFILRFWSIKKTMLRQKHQLDWKTPAELNPGIAYDSYGLPRVTTRQMREITPIVQKQIHNPNEKIKTFERTLDGTVYVWTRVGEFELGRYVVQRKGDRWKFVRRDRVQQ